MMQGRLIVLEGLDGSGKSTQFAMLCQALEQRGTSFRKVTFPRYQQPSSALVRAYLQGEFGSKPEDVNAYAASAFYAVDRYASFKTDWQKDYLRGGLVLCDRYTTSNACHQAGKLPEQERGAFLDWLYDFEFRLLGLPAPSLVIYLNTELDAALQAIAQRQKKLHEGSDIHERDSAYLAQCLDAGRQAARHYGWRIISCTRQGQMRPPDEIHQDIWQAAAFLLEA